MKRALRWLRKSFEICLGVLIIALLLPLLAVAVFLLRGLLLVGGIIALGAAGLLYCTYPRFRHWADRIGHPVPRLRVR